MKISLRSLARGPQDAAVLCCCMLVGVGWSSGVAVQAQTPVQLVASMVANENAAAAAHERYEYLSNERSGRTGGHLWTERVVETAPGRVRLLTAVDGRPLTAEQAQREQERLEEIREHPEVFIKREQSTRAEEKRAREMMDVLPKDFLFEKVRLDNGVWRMEFRPNPDYTPSSVEERILHNMAGELEIDARALRLLHLEFHLTQDVPIGFGLVANVHTGTTFVSDREVIEGRWHTMHVATQVRAKALLFKTIDLNVDVHRWDFHPLDHEVTVPEATTMLLRDQVAAAHTAVAGGAPPLQ